MTNRWFSLLARSESKGSGPGSDEPATALVRDSAGIAILENGTLDGVIVFEPGEPIVEIGQLDGPEEYLLAGAGAVGILSDGGVAIADRSSTVRFYNADGAFVESFGRKGEGPGEFQSPSNVWERGDGSIVVFDARLWRLTAIEDGELAATHPIRPPGVNADEAGILDDGSVIVRETLLRIAETGFEPTPVTVRRVTWSDAAPDTILTADGPRFGRASSSNGNIIVTRPLFEPSFAVAAAGNAVYTADCSRSEYRELSPTGELRRIVRWSTGDRAVHDEDIGAMRAADLEGTESPEERRASEEIFDARPVNDIVPACQALAAGPTGTVWVPAHTDSFAGPFRWGVFRDGNLAGVVHLPRMTFLVAIGADRYAVLNFDELDVERVRVYQLPEVLR